jgi:hypothetical protein
MVYFSYWRLTTIISGEFHERGEENTKTSQIISSLANDPRRSVHPGSLLRFLF